MFREMLILLVLYQGPNHGYGIQQRLSYIAPINNRTLYHALQKFEEKGFVSKEFIRQDKKAGKNMYFLQDKGLEELKRMLRDFDSTRASSWIEVLLRIGHPELLEEADMKRVIELRENYLTKADSLNHVLNIDDRSQYIKLISSHITERVVNELSFLQKVKRELVPEETQ